MEILHKDVCIDIAKVHRLVYLYVAQPKLAQLVKSIDLFGEADPHAFLELEAKEPDFYEPIIGSSGLNDSLQHILIGDLRRQDHQAYMALLLLQTLNFQILLLGQTYHSGIHFLDPVFFTGLPTSPNSMSPDHVHTRDVQPYLREIIATRLKPRLTRLEIPHHGLWDVVWVGHQSLDLGECIQLSHLTTSVDGFLIIKWPVWGARAVYHFGVLPKTLTHLTIGGVSWDLGHLLAHLALEKPSGRTPELHNLVVFIAEYAQTKQIFAQVQTLEDAGITTTLRYDDLCYCLRLDTLDTGYRSRHMDESLRSLEMRGHFEPWRYVATAREVLQMTHGRNMEERGQIEEEELKSQEDQDENKTASESGKDI